MKNQKKYKFKTKVPGNGKDDILLYRFHASMSLSESEIFILGRLKELLLKHNAILHVQIDALVLHDDGTYIILGERTFSSDPFEIEILIDGLDSQLGSLVYFDNEDESIELKNYREENLQEILGESIKDVMSAYVCLKDASWGKKIDFEFKNLLDEIIQYSLKQFNNRRSLLWKQKMKNR